MELSYKSTARHKAPPATCKSPLEVLRARVGEQRKKKIEEDTKLQSLRDEMYNIQISSKINRTVELLSEQHEAILATQKKAKCEENERSHDRQQLECKLKRHEIETLVKKQRDFDKKIKESQQSKDCLAEREQWRKDITRERIESEKLTSDEDARRRREEYLSQIEQKKQKQRSEWEQRQHELKQKEKKKHYQRKIETSEEKKEISHFERKGRRQDTLMRKRYEAAHEVGKQVKEQIEGKLRLKHEFQQALKSEQYPGGIHDTVGNNSSRAIPKVSKDRLLNYVAPAVCYKHHSTAILTFSNK